MVIFMNIRLYNALFWTAWTAGEALLLAGGCWIILP